MYVYIRMCMCAYSMCMYIHVVWVGGWVGACVNSSHLYLFCRIQSLL